MRARRRVPRPTIKSAHYPAPIGGINTLDGGTVMPPQDAVLLYNLLPAEYGVRSRLGYREWCLGLTGAADNQVRTILPFSASNPTNNKLFACTTSGIYDVTDSSASPTLSIAFGATTTDAGWGTCCTMSTPAGRFLLYTDEVNGLYIYPEGGSWSKVALGVAQLWAPSTSYLVDDQVVNGGKIYKCVTAGLSASSGGPTGTGTAIADGTAAWDYVSASASSVIGPSVADQEAGFTGDPADFVFVTVFKSRVWLVEKNSTRAWYLDTNSVYGVATSFDFGPKMRAGGPLRGLYDWSYDGGSGLDTLLVGISGAGDIVIYQGTDPSSASSFGIKGSWFVGGIPAGRRIATNYGGELLVCSLLGIIPLSKLVVGRDPADWKQYETAKITNLFNDLASQKQALDGWALHIHPTDNALLVLVPTEDGSPTEQLAMAFGTKGWSRYRDLPMLAAGAWDGTLYFGTADGRVCQNTEYVDAVTLDSSVAVTHDTGSSPLPVVTGTATATQTIKIKITGTGVSLPSPTIGGAGFAFSTDSGATWSAPQFAYADGSTLAGTGLVVLFPSGGLYNGDTYHFSVTAGVVYQQGGGYTPVQYVGLTSFRALGGGNNKRVQMIRPTVLSQATAPLLQCVAQYDFAMDEPAQPVGNPLAGGNTWDSGKWDGATWAGVYGATQPIGGAVGMGRNIAVAFAGSATARTVIVGFDLFYDEGWPL